jgi:hypothetical protein
VSADHEPLAQIRKHFRISWNRCPIATTDLKKVTRRSDIKGLAQSLGYPLLITATSMNFSGRFFSLLFSDSNV